VLHREAVVPGVTFVLGYTHTSEQVPVRGTFRIEVDRTLTVIETAFGGFGPGLPWLKPGDAWGVEGDLLVQRDPGVRLPELTVRVLPITRHRLRLPSGGELDLSALMGEGGPVRLRVGPP
jgi:hypothetical protein